MGAMSFRITGDKQLIAKLRKYAAENPKVVGAALYQEAELIMTDSKQNYVPVDHTPLRESGHVQLPKYSSNSIVVTLGFGGPAKAYALAVHETPSEHDPPSWRGVNVHFTVGGPKYLEKPVLAAAPTLGRSLADRIGRSFK